MGPPWDQAAPSTSGGGAGNGLRWKQQVEPSCGGARREARVTPQTGHPGGGGEHPTKPAQGSPRDTEPSRQPAPPQGGPDTAQGLGCPLLPSQNLGPGVQLPTPLYGFLPSPGSSAGPARAAVPRPRRGSLLHPASSVTIVPAAGAQARPGQAHPGLSPSVWRSLLRPKGPGQAWAGGLDPSAGSSHLEQGSAGLRLQRLIAVVAVFCLSLFFPTRVALPGPQSEGPLWGGG